MFPSLLFWRVLVFPSWSGEVVRILNLGKGGGGKKGGLPAGGGGGGGGGNRIKHP